MKNTIYESFFSNLFNASRIIDSRLQVFLRSLIASLETYNTDGAFTAIIADLTAAYTAYFGSYETKDVNIAERMGATTSLNTVSRLFADTVRSKHSAISAIYPEGSSIYQAFFPKGMTEFSRLTRVNIQAVSHRMATKATEYMGTLGGLPFADIFTGLETNITAAIGTQNLGKATVKKISGDVITSRLPVENQLMVAMFTVGAKFWPNQSTCRAYFDFSLLFGKKSSQSVVKSGEVAALSSALCIGKGIDDSVVFTLRNLSDFPLTFYAAHVLNGAMVGVPIVLPPRTKNVSSFAEFGAADMLFLYVKDDTGFAGNWEVRMD